MGTPTQVYVWSYPNFSASAGRPFRCVKSKKQLNFFQDFKSLAKEVDESLAKHKALEYEIERLLRAAVSQNIMSIVQSPTVVETSDL
ncbi:hypothetical protein Tco_1376255 [Tanacetum coccineum]